MADKHTVKVKREGLADLDKQDWRSHTRSINKAFGLKLSEYQVRRIFEDAVEKAVETDD